MGKNRRGLETVIFSPPRKSSAYGPLFLKPASGKEQDIVCFCLWQSSMHQIHTSKHSSCFSVLQVKNQSHCSADNTYSRVKTFHSYLECSIAYEEHAAGYLITKFGVNKNSWHFHIFGCGVSSCRCVLGNQDTHWTIMNKSNMCSNKGERELGVQNTVWCVCRMQWCILFKFPYLIVPNLQA